MADRIEPVEHTSAKDGDEGDEDRRQGQPQPLFHRHPYGLGGRARSLRRQNGWFPAASLCARSKPPVWLWGRQWPWQLPWQLQGCRCGTAGSVVYRLYRCPRLGGSSAVASGSEGSPGVGSVVSVGGSGVSLGAGSSVSSGDCWRLCRRWFWSLAGGWLVGFVGGTWRLAWRRFWRFLLAAPQGLRCICRQVAHPRLLSSWASPVLSRVPSAVPRPG